MTRQVKSWRVSGLVVLSVLLLFGPATVSAHTIAAGTVNAGLPGSVTIWLGSYHTGAPNEGSLTLTGANPPVFGPVTEAFDLLSSTLPTGLVAGTNYFYTPSASCCSTPAGTFTSATNPTSLAVTQWQGVTFDGLLAGTYNYTISGMASVNWADWNSNTSNWTGSLIIPESSVTGVPAPGSLALIGLGLAGLGVVRRRVLKG